MSYLKFTERKLPRFSGIKTFFRLPFEHKETSKKNIIICGIPFDGGTTYRSGARMAPSRIREISSLGRGYHMQHNQDVFKNQDICDIGDLPTNPLSLPKTYTLIEQSMLYLTKQQKKVISVGGDHSITLPILRALNKIYGKLNLICFDAHFDTYPKAYGEEYHHGSFVRHAILEGLVNKVSQFGIRGPFVTKSDLDFVKQNHIYFQTVDDIKQSSFKPMPFKGPCYLSFDVDCLDPAYAPGTGTPVVGGLSTYEIQQIFRKVLQIENCIGLDIVEVNPAYDHADITSLAATDALFEGLNLMIKTQ